MRRTGTTLAFALLACVGLPGGLGLAPDSALAQRGGQADEFPPFDKTIEGLTQVVSTADGASGLYDLYKDEKTGKLLGVLPRNYDSQLLMIACTVSGGDSQAGVMGPTYYAKWRRYDKQLALAKESNRKAGRREVLSYKNYTKPASDTTTAADHATDSTARIERAMRCGE